MENEKSLNSNIDNKKIMEQIEKKKFNTLRTFVAYNFKIVDKIRKNKWKDIDKNIENDLLRLGLITFDKKSKNLWLNDRYVTIKGYDYFCKLRSEKREDWKERLTIANLIMFSINIYLLGKNLNWW